MSARVIGFPASAVRRRHADPMLAIVGDKVRLASGEEALLIADNKGGCLVMVEGALRIVSRAAIDRSSGVAS